MQREDLEPCPFCNRDLVLIGTASPKWEHPAQTDEDLDCPAFHLSFDATRENVVKWNRRSLAGGPVVKLLEWREIHSTDFAGDVLAEAETAIGCYKAWGSGLWGGPFGGNNRHQGDLETAKAAAQSDYEHRILSALA